MEAIKKQITVYVSTDGKEFDSTSDCKKWEKHLRLDAFHKKLLACNFHARCKIEPYFHNVEIKFMGTAHTSPNLSNNNSYCLMGGRMGNGDDRIRYKLRGGTIAFIRYSTDDNEQKYICSIPSEWMNLDMENLQQQVDKFIEERKIFKKVVDTTQTINYVEV